MRCFQILLELQLVNQTLLSQLEHALDRAVREAKFNQSAEEDEEDATEVITVVC